MNFTTLLAAAILFLSSSSYAQYDYSLTKNIDKDLRTRVNFWKRVYTEITSKQAFIHDRDTVGIVYDVIDIPQSGHRRRARYARKKLLDVKRALLSIAKKKGKQLSKTERKYYLILKGKTPDDIRKMAHRIRYQYGLKDNYFIGLKRSYKYLDYIKSVLKEYDVPRELMYLPHVESSFNYQAYSKVGAAGIWQFMRGTARNYRLKITYAIDERRDVFKATKAAARLLKFNYSRIKSWPLAITAYNHGLASMNRAVKKLGTKDISQIIKNYEGRRFGFASQNFYSTFLATAEISSEPEKYFPSFKKPEPFEYTTINLPRELTVENIKEILKLSNSDIREYNPAIRSTAYRSPLFLPKNFSLRLRKLTSVEFKNFYSLLKNTKIKTHDLHYAGTHKIRRGDSLYKLSKIYRVSVEDLIRFNRIANPSRIFPGMKIKIPSLKDLTEGKAAVAKIKEVSIQPEVKKGSDVIDKKPVFTKITAKKPDPVEIEDDRTIEQAQAKVDLSMLKLDLTPLKNSIYQIQVEPEETLGHYADWSNQATQNIRTLNRMHFREYISLGQKLKIKLSESQKKKFITARAEHHLSIQEDFFQNFKVDGELQYSVKAGDSINRIIQDFNVPFWLFKKTQPKTFTYDRALMVGELIKIPKVVSLKGAD